MTMQEPRTVLSGVYNPSPLFFCTVSAGRNLCYERSAGVVTLMCMHEHQHLSAVCAGCLEKIRALAAAGNAVACTKCGESSRPHRCLMAEVKWEPRDHPQ